MKIIVLAAIVAALSGCVVAQPVGYADPEYGYTSTVVYPTYADAYLWDAGLGLWFFNYGGGRYYMNRGWNHGYGYPRGYYHGAPGFAGHREFHGPGPGFSHPGGGFHGGPGFGHGGFHH